MINILNNQPIETYHIDCTYDINLNKFSVLNFGLSDCSGQFFLISSCIISHETEMDFQFFYQTLNEICIFFKYKLNLKFIMQDACVASYNAAKSIFGENVTILMCYFHLLKNVKEKIRGWIEQELIINCVRKLHFC